MAEVELERLVELGVRVGVGAEQALRLGVRLGQRDRLRRPAGDLHVAEGLVVDREHRRGRAELGRHVRDRRAVGEGQAGEAGAVELHELPDDPVVAEHLRDRQHEVGGRGPGAEAAGELQADDRGGRLRERLAEQHGLRLDAADAEAEDADAVDHGGVRVGADEGVGERDQLAVDLAGLHDGREVLEVDLVDDAGAGRHGAEVAERLLRPPQEHVALLVALVLALDVGGEGAVVAEAVDLHGVVDHEVGGDERVDQRRVAAEGAHRVAHGREVDDARHAGEVLHDDARRQERHLAGQPGAGRPAGQGADVLLGHEPAAAVAEHGLEQDLDGVRRPVEALPDGVEAVDHVRAAARLQGVACGEGVGRCAH